MRRYIIKLRKISKYGSVTLVKTADLGKCNTLKNGGSITIAYKID